MRKDLQKLLCEQERNGSSRKYKEVRRKKEFKDLEDPEFNAGVEGMKVRYIRGHGNLAKSFSENFAPLWGIIRKNAGRKWDDVYSELSQVFDMRNHVNAHILVHLWDFVERNTWFEDGQVWVLSYSRTELAETSCEYYVHPVTGILTKSKEYETYNQGARRRKEEREAKKRETCIVVNNSLELRRVDVDSPWFVCTIKRLAWPKGVSVYKEYSSTYSKRKRGYWTTEYPPITAIDAWTGKKVERYGVDYCVSRRSASKKDLKNAGI